MQELANFTQKLELTPDQQKQLGAILDDSRSKFHALDESLDPQRDADSRAEPRQIARILTPEQQPKFDAFLQQLDVQRKETSAAIARSGLPVLFRDFDPAI